MTGATVDLTDLASRITSTFAGGPADTEHRLRSIAGDLFDATPPELLTDSPPEAFRACTLALLVLQIVDALYDSGPLHLNHPIHISVVDYHLDPTQQAVAVIRHDGTRPHLLSLRWEPLIGEAVK